MVGIDEPASGNQLPLRQRMLLLLGTPRCARELFERLEGASLKAVETALQRLARNRYVECATPTQRQSRLYRRTLTGDLWIVEFADCPPKPASDYLSQNDLNTRSWVQAGKYRRLVLRALDRPMRSKENRKAALQEYERIGANHVHAVLRDFRDRGIAYRNTQGQWILTSLGRRFREIELDGLPERPGINAPLWSRLTAPQEQGEADKDQEADEETEGV